MWMAEPWKQPQVPLTPINHKPHPIGDPCHTSHPSMHTHHGEHSDACMAVERVDDHTVLTITPSIHPNHTLHHQPCAGQHPSLLPSSCSTEQNLHDSVHHECLDNVLFCMPCHSIALQSLLSTPLASTLRFIGSHSLSQPFKRHRVTVPTLILVETVDDTMQSFHTWLMARKLHCEKEGMQVWVCDDRLHRLQGESMKSTECVNNGVKG